MSKKYLILFLSLFMPMIMLGQYAETIRTGRPGQSIGAYTLGSSVFQVQSGITYNSFDHPLVEERSSYEFSNVFRLGILEKLEVSAVLNYRTEEGTWAMGETLSGVSNTQIGTRYNILEANGPIPALGVQARVLLKLQREEFRRENTGAQVLIAAGNRITDWMSYGANLGFLWAGDGNGPVELYTFNFGFSLTERIGAMVEVYGRLEDFSTNYDVGLSYLVNEDLSFDASAGWQGTEEYDDWFVDAGISFRFDWRD